MINVPSKWTLYILQVEGVKEQEIVVKQLVLLVRNISFERQNFVSVISTFRIHIILKYDRVICEIMSSCQK